MASIVCFGEMLIDFVQDTAGVSLAESRGFLKAPDGAPANIACAITRLSGSSAFIGKVRKDESGTKLISSSLKGKAGGFYVKVVDTTGAGDSFVGSILCSIAKDDSIFTWT